MSPVQPNNFEKLITLKQASELLGVSIETLLSWNQHNILKPTITVEGEIGYTQSQVNQFLKIRQATQKTEPVVDIPRISFSSQTPAVTPVVHAPLPDQPSHVLHPVAKTVHKTINPYGDFSKKDGNKFRSSTYLNAFAAIVVLITIAILPQLVPDRTLQRTQLAANNNNDTTTAGQQTSKLSLSKQANGSLPIQLQDKDSIKNLNNEGESISKEKIMATDLYEVINPKETAGKTPSLSGKQHPSDIATDGATSDLASVAYFDTCTNCSDDKDSAIDARGNIKGETDKTDTLAAVTSSVDSMVKSDATKPGDTTNQLIFLSLGFLAVLYLFQKQFAFSARRSPVAQRELYNNPPVSQKVLEIGQKTDGTVVLLVRGKEYKISKPEMNSESDQFIERLMTLTQTGLKEIEYDSLKADKVYLTTPLSRLVTRLGFVGMKRDLFFPRTSKNSVLFRKYLTEADLAGMNLTTDKILNEINLLS